MPNRADAEIELPESDKQSRAQVFTTTSTSRSFSRFFSPARQSPRFDQLRRPLRRHHAPGGRGQHEGGRPEGRAGQAGPGREGRQGGVTGGGLYAFEFHSNSRQVNSFQFVSYQLFNKEFCFNMGHFEARMTSS